MAQAIHGFFSLYWNHRILILGEYNFGIMTQPLNFRLAFSLVLLGVVGLLCLSIPQPALAADPPEPTALCLPDTPPESAGDCLPLGPAAFRAAQAKQGLRLPLQPLPAAPPPADLVTIPFSYAMLPKGTAVPVYTTLDDAIADQNPAYYIQPGALRYISYVDTVITDGGSKPDYFMLRDGGWVADRDVATRVGAANRFQGLLFRRTPERPFGWILPFEAELHPKAAPGYNAPDANTPPLLQYQLVQIYATQQADNVDWYLVGPGQWVEQRKVGRVLPNPVQPQGVTGSRWIEVNLFEQTLSVYENNQLVFATLIATGVEPFYTQPGVFQIYQKLDATPMSGAFEADRSDYYYLQDVPWTMYYDKSRALHTAYWRTRFGYPQSHGCVNLAPGDAHWLYNWAKVGDWVYVWDPSGKTPTDPKDYSDGGA